MSRITLLGTGTCQIQKHRIASSILIERDEVKILFDIGRGVTQRLAEIGLSINQIEHIVFSHYHPDHFSDLIPFLHASAWSREAPRTTDLFFHGAPGLHKLMHDLYELCGKESIYSERYKLEANEYQAGGYTIANNQYEFTSLPPAGNHGVKFTSNNKTVAITGDSNFHDEEVKFLTNVDLAIIDAGHLEIEQIIQLCVKAQPAKLVCSHIYAELNQKELSQLAKSAGFKGELLIAHDLLQIDLAQ